MGALANELFVSGRQIRIVLHQMERVAKGPLRLGAIDLVGNVQSLIGGKTKGTQQCIDNAKVSTEPLVISWRRCYKLSVQVEKFKNVFHYIKRGGL